MKFKNLLLANYLKNVANLLFLIHSFEMENINEVKGFDDDDDKNKITRCELVTDHDPPLHVVIDASQCQNTIIDHWNKFNASTKYRKNEENKESHESHDEFKLAARSICSDAMPWQVLFKHLHDSSAVPELNKNQLYKLFSVYDYFFSGNMYGNPLSEAFMKAVKKIVDSNIMFDFTIEGLEQCLLVQKLGFDVPVMQQFHTWRKALNPMNLIDNHSYPDPNTYIAQFHVQQFNMESLLWEFMALFEDSFHTTWASDSIVPYDLPQSQRVHDFMRTQCQLWDLIAQQWLGPKCIWAGGSLVEAQLENKFAQHMDVDLWVNDVNVLKNILVSIEQTVGAQNVYYAYNKSIVTVYFHASCPIKSPPLQLIYVDSSTSMESYVGNFDFDYLKSYSDGRQIYRHADCIRALLTRQVRNVRNPIRSYRLQKALNSGFTIMCPVETVPVTRTLDDAVVLNWPDVDGNLATLRAHLNADHWQVAHNLNDCTMPYEYFGKRKNMYTQAVIPICQIQSHGNNIYPHKFIDDMDFKPFKNKYDSNFFEFNHSFELNLKNVFIEFVSFKYSRDHTYTREVDSFLFSNIPSQNLFAYQIFEKQLVKLFKQKYPHAQRINYESRILEPFETSRGRRVKANIYDKSTLVLSSKVELKVSELKDDAFFNQHCEHKNCNVIIRFDYGYFRNNTYITYVLMGGNTSRGGNINVGLCAKIERIEML